MAYDAFLDVSSDGTFKGTLPGGSQRTGKYELDEAVTPHKFTATEKDGRRVRGIYRVERETLSIRVADESPDSGLPTNFIDFDDGTNLGLIELERKKE
jgi:hypothetical protein